MVTVTIWLLIAGGALLGALVGGAVALLVVRRGDADPDTVRGLRREMEDYRREVADHYVETAKRVDALTHAYKSVYDHLEDGAYRLVGERELRDRLEAASSEPITIEGIGQRVLQRSASGPTAGPSGHGSGHGGPAHGQGSDDATGRATGGATGDATGDADRNATDDGPRDRRGDR